jgi:hypothetical protein
MKDKFEVSKKPHIVIRLFTLGFILILVLAGFSTLMSGIRSSQPFNFGFSLGSVGLLLLVLRQGPKLLWSVLFVCSLAIIVAVALPGYVGVPDGKIYRSESSAVLHGILVAQKATHGERDMFFSTSPCPAERTGKKEGKCDWQQSGWRAIEFFHEDLIFCSYACYAGDSTNATFPGTTTGSSVACAATCDTDGNGLSSEFIFVLPDEKDNTVPDWSNKLRTGHGMLSGCKKAANGCPIDETTGKPTCDSIVRCTPGDVY